MNFVIDSQDIWIVIDVLELDDLMVKVPSYKINILEDRQVNSVFLILLTMIYTLLHEFMFGI